MLSSDVVIIGAGLAGLSLANQLAARGLKVKLLERSFAPGGRLATRRSPFGAFDHGAQYLTNRSPAFTALINLLALEGHVAAWKPSGKDSPHAWWTGNPGMSTIGDALARMLDLDLGMEALDIAADAGGFVVRARREDGSEHRYAARQVVAAIPAPQAHALLSTLDPAFEHLDRVRMAPCCTALLAFGARLKRVRDITRGSDDDVLALIARNSSKPGRSGETFVLHAMPDWSRDHFDASPETVLAAMIAALKQQTGLGAALPPPLHVDLERWPHALVQTPLDCPFLGNADNTLFACGDWCIAGRAEAAHESGLALAEHLLSL